MNKNNYQSILVIVIGFMTLSYIFKINELNLAALIIGVLCLLSGHFRQLLLWVWGKIAEILGWFNSRVLLSIIFYGFLTPMALIKNLLSNSKSFKKKGSDSYYFDRNHKYTKEDIENPW